MSRAIRRSPGRSQQRGLTLLGLTAIGAIAFVIVIIVVKVMPTVLEFQSIRKAVIKVARESGDSVVSIQQGFDKISAIDDITSISGRDLLIEKRDGAFVVSFQYEKRIPLVGPASLVLDYRGSSRDK